MKFRFYSTVTHVTISFVSEVYIYYDRYYLPFKKGICIQNIISYHKDHSALYCTKRGNVHSLSCLVSPWHSMTFSLCRLCLFLFCFNCYCFVIQPSHTLLKTIRTQTTQTKNAIFTLTFILFVFSYKLFEIHLYEKKYERK